MSKLTLSQWLQYIESSHSKEIDLGLERCRKVFESLAIKYPNSTVITVGGTNGKGTTCAFIEKVCLSAGLTVGVFSSPHLLSFCERIRLNGVDIDESSLCEIFEHIESKRDITSLSYFEYSTLAAFEAFFRSQPDVVILEVGLGGRLDAVNILDPNIAVITSIGLDHQAWLGETKELIAYEKAGIFRPNIPIIIGQTQCPSSMLEYANSLGSQPLLSGIDFSYNPDNDTAKLNEHIFDLSACHIPKQNIATGLATLRELSALLGKNEYPFLLDNTKVQDAIDRIRVKGRHQILQAHIKDQQPLIIADVAHNEDSARQLRNMIEQYSHQRCHIVVGMLKDKNIEVSLQAFEGMNVKWHCATLDGPRGENASRIAEAARRVKVADGESSSIQKYDDVQAAYKCAKREASTNDTILVMGSFLTVSAVL